MQSLLRRIVHFFALVALVFSPLTSLAQRLPPGTPGCPVTTAQPYRSPSVTTVFVVTPECKKRPIFNPEVYFSHFDDWNKVVFLEQYEMDAIANHPLNFLPWGARREFTNGSLVKTTDDPRVYLVENGDAHPIESEQAFTSLGFSFNQIEDVDPAVLASFRKQSVAIKGPENIPPSTVFKYADDPKVYVLKKENGVETKEYIPTYDALKAIARADRIVILPPVKTFPDKPKPTTFPVNPQPSVTKPDPKPVPTPDNTPPSVNFITPDADATLSGSASIIANATDNKGMAYVRFSVDAIVLKTDDTSPYEATLATTALTNGTHTLSAFARDLSGNVATTTRNIIISNQTPSPDPTPTSTSDTTPPTVSFTLPAANASVNGTVSVQADASDASGIASVQFKVDSSLLSTDTSAPYTTSLDSTTLANGVHTLTAIATDTQGNIETTTRSITVANVVTPPADVTAPTVAFTSPVADGVAVSGSLNIAVTASDSSGISAVRFKIGNTVLADDSDSPYGLALDTTAFSNGSYTLTAIAADPSGNQGTATRTIVISNVIVPPPDTSAPSVVITSPASGSSVSGSITIAATASDDTGVSSVQFKAGSTVIGTDTTSPFSVSFNTASVADGSLTLTAIASDAAGNQTTVTRSVTVSNVVVPPPDVTAPSVSFSAPASSATVSGSVTVSVTASDNVGVSSVQFKAGATVIATDNTSPYSVTLDTTGLTNGSVTLTAIAMDAAGNQGTATRSVTVSNVAPPTPDVTAPSVSFSAPANNATVNGAVTISASASDDVGVSSVQFKIGSTVIATDNTSPYSATLDTTTLTNGAYTLTVVATDAAGNQGTATRAITISNVAAPVLSPVKITIIGSSTPAGKNLDQPAYGGSTANMANSWPNRLAAQLAIDRPGSSVTNLAMAGYSTFEAMPTGTPTASGRPAVDAAKNITAAIATNPNAIIVSFANMNYPTDEIMANLYAIHAAASAANIPVWVSGPQANLTATSTAIAAARDLQTRINTMFGSRAFDFFTPLANADGTGKTSLILTDNTHPNATGHLALYNIVYGANIPGNLTVQPAVAPVTPDVTAPSVSFSAPASGATVSGSITVSATASDNVGVSSVQFKVGNTVIGTDTTSPYSVALDTATVANGSATLTATAVDAAGNQGIATRSVIVSNVVVTPAPGTLPISDNFNDNSLNSAMWTVSNPVGSVAETGGRLAVTVPSASNGDWWTTTSFAPVASAALPSGDLDITVKNDTGNYILGTHSGIALWLDRQNVFFFGRLRNGIDTQNGLSLDRVVAGVGSGGICKNSVTTIPVYLRVKRTGTTYNFDYSTDGTTWTSFCSNISLGFTPDKAGLFLKKWQTGTGDVTMTFDDFAITAPSAPSTPPPADVTAPTVSFTAPASGATVSGSVTVSANASDAVGVSSVQFKVGSTIIATDTTSPYSATFDSTAFADGSATLSAVAVDAAGNVGTATQTVTVSNQQTPPPVQGALNNCYIDAGTSGSNINLALTPTRTSGVAPLSVYFETRGTTAVNVQKPFHELAYCWNFGDANSGTFAQSGKSKNRAYGPSAAHVFETPGTYTVTVNARDAQGQVASKAIQVTVLDPANVYTASNTVCLSAAGNFSGCPSGAKQVTGSSISTLTSEIDSGKRRVLLNRGETYSGGMTIDQTGPGIIGAYGSGAAPLISTTGYAFYFSDQDLATVNNPNEPYPTDWRISDIDVDGQTGANSGGVYIGGLTKNVLLLRVRVKNAGFAFGSGTSIIDWWNNNGNPGHDVIDGFMIQDSDARDLAGGQGHNLLGISGHRFAMLGTTVTNSSGGEHVMRAFWLDRAVISNNYLGNAPQPRHVLKLHAPGFNSGGVGNGKYSEQIIISDNTFDGAGGTQWTVAIGPTNDQQDERLRDVIVERNFFPRGTVDQYALSLSGSDHTVRDNVLSRGAFSDCISIFARGVEPAPTRINVTHNTCYGTSKTTMVSGGGFTSVVGANNLNVSVTPSAGVSSATLTNNVNSTSAGTTFVSSAPVSVTDFRPGSGSAAIGAGSAAYTSAWDFNGTPRAFGVGAPASDAGAWDF
jgi:hypothetical protein